MGAFGDAIRRALVLNFVTGRENTAENARAAGLASAEAVDFLETLVRVGKNLKGTVSPPSQALGVDGDTYTNSITTDYYIKDANGWQFQFRLKGADGSSPVKGVDYQDGYTPRKGIDYRDGVDGKSTYQLWLAAGNVGTVAQFLASQHGEDGKGLDGADGAKIFDETYAPDDATGKDGDEWYHSKSLTAYDRYFKIAGKWKLRYSGTGTGTVVTPPANAKPVIVFNAPASGATVTVGQALTLTATATDDVSVATVEFLNGTTGASLGMGNKNGSTYTVGYTPTAAGSLSLVAKATDGAGLSDQATVNITVQTAAVSAPAISSFSPATAAVDASVTISGTNFGANQGTSSTVKFNGILANVLSWSDTTIVAKVPTGGATGKITVITASGTAISAATFTVGATNNKVQLFIIGDSITMGAQQGGPGSGNTYPEVVASKLNAASNRFTLFQRGYPSMNARWFINNELQNVLNEFDPITYGGGIMVVTFFGANDLVLYDAPGQPATNHTVQGVYNTNVELHNTFRAGGAKTVIVPILNRVDSYGQAPYSTTFNNDRLAVNDLYFNNRVAFANELADLRNQGNLYPSNAPANPTYFADGVHPTTAGAALIGQEVANAVARYYGLNLAGGGTGATMPPIQNPQNLTWTALVNTANAPATRLYNTSAAPEGWNSFAKAVQTIPAMAGAGIRAHLRTPVKPGVNSQLLGFTTVANPVAIADFKFAMYWSLDKYGVFENNAFAFPQTLLSVAGFMDIIVSDKVRYYLDGALFHTSLQSVPAGTLYLFAALYTETGSVSEILNPAIEGASGVGTSDVSSVHDLTWSTNPTSSANVANQNGGLVKTAATDGFDAGSTANYAVSASQASGEKARIRLLNVAKPSDEMQGQIIGFTNTAGTVDLATIKSALYWDSANIRVFENGALKYETPFDSASSAFDVVATDTAVDYYRDTVKLPYSSPAPSFATPLLVRAALYGGTPPSFIPAAKLQGLNLVPSGY